MKSSIDRYVVGTDTAFNEWFEKDPAGPWCRSVDVASAEADYDRLTGRLDAALREIRELHGELTNTRAQLTAVMELDGDVFTANARLGGCQQRVAELEAELAGCQTTGWPGR